MSFSEVSTSSYSTLIKIANAYSSPSVTAAAEVAGKVVLDRGLASHMRPRKYYTINRQTLDAVSDDVEQFLNFFVIEFQRIVFAENVYATIAAFTSALLGYLLVKIVPTWGLALIATSLVYFVPLIYIKNQKVIDEHLHHAGEVINQQATQVRDLAAQHTSHITEVVQHTASEYSAKAQEMIGSAKNRAASPSAPNPANMNPYKNEPEREITKEDFPSVPEVKEKVNSTVDSAASEVKNNADYAATKVKSNDFTAESGSSGELRDDFASTSGQFESNDFPSAPSTEFSHTDSAFQPIPDNAVHIPENDQPEHSRVEEADGIRGEALAS